MPIVLTQKDVRQIQLAKSAFGAGTRILMQHLGLKQVEKVILAGAFGTRLDANSAAVIGLVPPCDLDRIISVGNAAGVGAQMALLSKSKRNEAAKVALTVKYLELAATTRF